MGSYAECWLGPFYIGATKYDVDDGLMQFFRPADKRVLHGKLENLPFQMRRRAEQVEREDDVTVVFYQCSNSALRSRLELRGYSRDVAKKAFAMGLQAEINRYSSYDGSHAEIFEPTNRLLQSIDVEQWLAALRVIRSKGLKQSHWDNDANEYQGTLIGYMLKNDWYGCPSPDPNVAIQLILDICPDNEDFIYDLTDLISAGDFSADEAAGIVNRVAAIFDNDTAAEVAVRSLRNMRLPQNIRILKLPDFEPLGEYPTVGPTGLNSMDVNGIAGSIELYLGTDVLSDETGALTPVQWTGFEAGLKRYQGEVLSKSVIQERFGRRLQACREDPSLLSRTDWTGIRAILSAIIDAFKDADANGILSSLAQYHGADV